MCVNIPSVDKTETRLYLDRARRFTIAVESLSTTEQNMFQLWYNRKSSLEEIADRYGLHPTTVKLLLRRIHGKMVQAYLSKRAG